MRSAWRKLPPKKGQPSFNNMETQNRFSQGSRFLLSRRQTSKGQEMERLQDTGEKLVIVIDPGHGGDNLGTTENGHEEKAMNMVTAKAMYEELLLYDDVEVYLTHTEDVKMSMEERAEYALSVDADFLFSIHYNASECHELFGAELWAPLDAPANAYAYQFGEVWLKSLRERGLFIRGVKTRVGNRGDYYGIIRESAARDIPAAILEHCHVDEAHDAPYCDSEEDLIQFGRDDATAVAKYFGLKSEALNVDYSGHPLADVSADVPVPITLQDTTAPDVCMIAFAEADYENGRLSLTVTAADYESPLIYYSYSLDGGATFSPRHAWPGADTLTGEYYDTFTLDLAIPDGTWPTVILRAYNMFEMTTDSNAYVSPKVFQHAAQDGLPEEALPPETSVPSDGSSVGSDADAPAASGSVLQAMSPNVGGTSPPSFLVFLEICLAVVVALFLILVVSQCFARRGRRKRGRRR